jgi:hypothetical protein
MRAGSDMGTVVKALVALVIGLGMLHFAQRMFVSTVKSQVTASRAPDWFTARPELQTPKFDADAFKRQPGSGIGPIDTAAGERAGVLNAARQADMVRRRAQDAVPLPQH